MKRTVLVAVLALIAGSSCSLFDRGDGLSEMTLERRGGSGALEVTRAGETVMVEDRYGVEPGDIIATSGDTQARLRLAGDREVWIGDQTRIEVIDNDAVGNESGTVLADADEPTSVTFGDVEAISARGVFRVDRLSAFTRAGVYEGSVRLDAPGQPRVRVPSYFQSPVTAGQIEPVVPYGINRSDEWDRLWLEDIVALDEELAQLADGFSSQIRRARPGLSYFADLPGANDVSAVRPYLERRVADLMIAYTIADADDGSLFGPSFRRSFRLHDAGAAWGLTVAIMEVNPRPMVAALERLIIGTGAIAGTGGSVQGISFGPAGEGGSGTAPGSNDGSGSPSDGGGDGGDGDGGDGGDGGGDGDGDGGGGGGNEDECQNVVDCTIQNPPPLPTPLPEDPIPDGILP